MSTGLALMVFAAGFGTRMGEWTRDRPKPLLELGGETLIARAVRLGREAGCSPIVANTHYLSGMLQPVLDDLGVTASPEPDAILDTGGGLRAALPLLGGARVMTLNPDVAWAGPNPLAVLSGTPWPETAGALLLLTPTEAARGYEGNGDFDLGPDGRIERGSAFVYTGAQLIATGTLGTVRDTVFSLNRVWSALAAEGRLFGTVYPGTWCDAGTPRGLTAAEAMLAGAKA